MALEVYTVEGQQVGPGGDEREFCCVKCKSGFYGAFIGVVKLLRCALSAIRRGERGFRFSIKFEIISTYGF